MRDRLNCMRSWKLSTIFCRISYMISESVSEASARLEEVGGRESSEDFCWCDSWLLRFVISLVWRIEQQGRKSGEPAFDGLRIFLPSQIGDQLNVFRDMIIDIQYVSLDRGFDILGSIRILERVESFFEIVFCRANIRDHDGSAISSKRVFQQPSEF